MRQRMSKRESGVGERCKGVHLWQSLGTAVRTRCSPDEIAMSPRRNCEYLYGRSTLMSRLMLCLCLTCSSALLDSS